MTRRRGGATAGAGDGWDGTLDDPASDQAGTDRPTLRLRGPGDLVQVIPYLLGFHPDESLVLVGLADGRVVVTVRIDLADLGAAAPPGVLASTVSAIARGGAEELVGVVFDDHATGPIDADRLPWDELHLAVRVEAERVGIGVDDVLFVSRRRRWSYCCGDPGCCPGDGIGLDDESSAVPATAAYAGLVALPDRDALAAVLDPEPHDVRERLLPALESAEAALVTATDGGRAHRSVKRALFAAARSAGHPGSSLHLPEDELVRFGAALATIPVRDSVWLAVDDARLDGRELWRWLGRRLPGGYAAAPLFLFGWASWRAGNGALAGMAAERALAADREYTAADLLLATLSHGIDPRHMPPLRQRSA